MNRFLILSIAVLFVSLEGACSLGDIRVDVTPELAVHYYKSDNAKIPTVDAGAYIDLEYTWRVGSNFSSPPADLRAFVHFRDSEGNLIEYETGKTLQNDHDLYPAMKSWEPGKAQVYTHRMFKVPESIGGDNYLVTVVIGLWSPQAGKRAELAWPGAQPKDRAYDVAQFFVRKNSKIRPMPFDESWNGPEPPDFAWRWSKKESTVTFERDRKLKSAELVISGHSPAEELQGSQTMRIFIHKKDDNYLVKELTFEQEKIDPLRIPIAENLFTDPEFRRANIRIIFEVDKLLPPKADDPRKEMGFMFHDIVLQPKDPES